MNLLKFSNRYTASSMAIAVALMGSAPAIAQTPDDTVIDDMDVIIVTARKRDESITEIPISVSAFSQDDLDDLGITSAEALSNFTPGFDFQPVGTGGATGKGSPQIRFRGVGLQINDPNAPVGAIFWDGVYVPQGIGLVPLIDLEQVEVIKGPQTAFFGRNTFAGAVNFIPAATTDEFEARLTGEVSATDVDTGYSLNATVSGALTDGLRARVTVSTDKTAASHEYQDFSPLGEENTDSILGSLDWDVTDNITLGYTGYYVQADDTSALSSLNADVQSADCNQTYDGTLRDVITGENLGDFSTDLSAVPGPQFIFFANRINQTTSTLFCGDIPEWDSSNQINPAFGGAPDVSLFSATPEIPGFFGTTPAFTAQENFENSDFFLNVVAPEGVFDNFISAPGGLGNTYETWRNNFSITADVGAGFTVDGFVSNGRNMNWGTFDDTYGGGNSGTSGSTLVPSYAGFLRNNEDFSTELRLTSPGEERLRYVVGINYQEQENDVYQTGFDILTSGESETLGVFAAIDYDITDELTISGEGRYQDDESRQTQDGSPGTDFEEQSQDFQKFMPRVILSYQPNDYNINIYGSYSQSYLPGNQTSATSYADVVPGFDADAAGFFTPVQQLDAYEIGLKHEVNSSLSYSVSAYQMDWKNQVFFVLSPTFVSLAQPGDSEYTGVEAEVDYKPLDWLSLSGGVNYVDGTFTDYIATGSVASAVLAPGLITSTVAVDASGNEIRYNPALTGTFSAEIALDDLFNVDSFFRIDGVHTGDFYIDNFEYNEVDAATRINIRAGAQFNDHLGFEIFGTNVTDDLTPTTSGGTTFTDFSSQNTRRFFGQVPRGAEYGLRLTATY